MAILPVTDPADPRISQYRDIRERDLVGREKLFIAEGRVVVNMLLGSSRFRALSLLIAEHRLAGVSDLLAKVPDGVDVFSAEQPVLDAIAGFPLHRGILAIGERTDVPEAGALLQRLPEQACILLLSGISNHDNMGGIFRNAAAFGADAVLLDADCCDPLYRKAIRVSVGGTLKVPYAKLGRDEDAVGLLQRHGFELLGLTPAGSVLLHEVVPTQRTAIVLGAEGPGLAPQLLGRMTGVAIPMAGGFDSLNVATTSGIVLHQLMIAAPRPAA